MTNPLSLPLFVAQDDDGSLVLDPDVVVDRTDGDALLLRNALHGRICTSRVFPLIWARDGGVGNDDDDGSDGERARGGGPSVRSVDFLRSAAPVIVERFRHDDRTSFGCSLRDLVWAHHHHPRRLSEALNMSLDEVEAVIQNAADALPTYDAEVIRGVAKSPWPTRTQRVVRWLQGFDRREVQEHDFRTRELFCSSSEGLVMAFCNVEELCYHNLENVIDLEHLFAAEGGSCSRGGDGGESETAIGGGGSVGEAGGHGVCARATVPPNRLDWGIEEWDIVRDTPNSEIFTFKISASSIEYFQPLREWDAFLLPINSDQRGGQRLIFRSDSLARDLVGLFDCHPLQDWPPGILGDAFMGINHVFRVNRFEPGDGHFSAHYDVPYCNSLDRTKSEYTLLLYLAEGRGRDGPALSIGEEGEGGCRHFGGFRALEGVIFHQSLRHEGRPFADTTKLFLRTELLHKVEEKDTNQTFDPELARTFNVACYNSVFHRELKEYATMLFDHSVRCRFRPGSVRRARYKYFLRTVDGASYVTNGHDYWFGSTPDNSETGEAGEPDVKESAVLAIMDYFNAQYRLKRFHRYLEQDREVDLGEDFDPDRPDAAFELLRHCSTPEAAGTGVTNVGYDCYDPLPEPWECDCPVVIRNCGPCGDSKRCACPLVKDYKAAGNFNGTCEHYLRYIIGGASATIFGGTLRIHLDDFVVTESDVRFRTSGYQERVWYAACQSDHQCNYFNPCTEVGCPDARLFHLPPVRYRRHDSGGLHLMVDMFNNGWTSQRLTVPHFHRNFPDNLRGTIPEEYIVKMAVEGRSAEGVPETTDDADVLDSKQEDPWPELVGPGAVWRDDEQLAGRDSQGAVEWEVEQTRGDWHHRSVVKDSMFGDGDDY